MICGEKESTVRICEIFGPPQKMQAHLIVDGNNALHAIPEFASVLANDRQTARQLLLQLLHPIHDSEGCRITVVFDGRKGIGSIRKYGADDSFSIVYSSSEQSADGAIERMLLASKFPEAITVATSDNLIRNCAFEVGASAIRAEDLPRWVDRAISNHQQILQNIPIKKKQTQFRNSIEIPDSFTDGE